jgi:hypothetical protein
VIEYRNTHDLDAAVLEAVADSGAGANLTEIVSTVQGALPGGCIRGRPFTGYPRARGETTAYLPTGTRNGPLTSLRGRPRFNLVPCRSVPASPHRAVDGGAAEGV